MLKAPARLAIWGTEMKKYWVMGAAFTVMATAMAAFGVVNPSSPPKACRVPDRSEVRIAGGTFQMGSTEFYEEEGPVHSETVGPFWIDRFDVTNAEFAKFVAATHYVTDAEKKPDPADYPEIEKDKLVAGGAVFFL